MYQDLGSLVTYVVWCQHPEGRLDTYLMYRTISNTGALSDPTKLETVFGCNEVVITGMNNGKEILIAFSGPRLSGARECTEGHTDGCLDVYYKETKDGAVTWSASRPVPRDSMKDAVNRLQPTLIRTAIGGRTYLYYKKNDVEAEYERLMFVHKSYDSIIFSLEREVLDGPKIRPTLTYTIYDEYTIIMQMAWYELVDKTYIGYYARTSDFVKWTDPVSIFRLNEDENSPPEISLVANRWTGPLMFAVYPDTEYSKYVTIWSSNHGATWTSEKASPSYYRHMATAICSLWLNPYFDTTLMILSTDSSNAEFGAFSYRKGKYEKGEKPFPLIGEKGQPSLVCAGDPENRKVILRSVVIGGETLYYTTQIYDPFVTSADDS